MQTILQDIRYAIRLLARTPGFTFVALLTLALGIGANTAIFTVVNALLLRPLPYGEPDRLVMVWQDVTARGGPVDEWATPGNFADWRKATNIFERVAAISGWRPTLVGDAEPEAIPGEQVSSDYFEVLGIRPLHGRTFRAEDDVPNAPRVVLIGEELWRRRFGGSASAVGSMVTLGGEPHEILGIMPASTRPIVNAAAEVWRPLRLNTTTPSRGAVILRSVASLAPGLSVEQAQAAASTLASQLEAQYPESNARVGFNVEPLHSRVVGDIRPGLLVLVGAVAFVLLIACVNIANLLLARGSSRARELAVRSALGASRTRVVRQLLTESVLLAIAGGVAGVFAGIWAVDALVAIAPENAPRLDEVTLDARVFAFAAALTIATGVLFGSAPALQSSKSRAAESLKDGTRGSSGAAGSALRRTLIVAEVALALMLLTGGGLLLRTFVELQNADLGFDPENVLVGGISLPRTSYESVEKQRVFYTQVLEQAATLPGVRHAALASVLPLGGDSDTNFRIEGRPISTTPGEAPVTWYRLVSADYFKAMGIPLVQGHTITNGEPAPSVIVNETFVSRYFPSEDPLGRRVRAGGDGPWFTIVGVVGDVHGRGARGGTRTEMYIPYWQILEGGMSIILKADSNPRQLEAPLKGIVRALDPNVPVAAVGVLSDTVGDSIDGPRFFAVVAVAFALMALVLAAIGIYGVMAYVVAQRTTEIGVRMALGATPGEVFRLVVGDGVRITAVGVALGIGASLAMARSLTTLLFGVKPWDPGTLAATASVLLVVAAAACFVPARRATRVDPMVALRAE
jgi:putative ABC transport system permease protein